MHEEIMKTKTIEELLLLVRNARGAIAYVAGEEIKRRLAVEQQRVPDGAEVCAQCGFPPSHHEPSCYMRRKSPRR